VGAAKRKILMRNLKSYDFFAGFGALDVRMEFRGGVCDCWITEPQSGKQLCHIGTGYDGFIDRFGSSFEIPEPENEPLLHR
jgi:hypothetical protein